jgi:hypothetical protein
LLLVAIDELGLIPASGSRKWMSVSKADDLIADDTTGPGNAAGRLISWLKPCQQKTRHHSSKNKATSREMTTPSLSKNQLHPTALCLSFI